MPISTHTASHPATSCPRPALRHALLLIPFLLCLSACQASLPVASPPTAATATAVLEHAQSLRDAGQLEHAAIEARAALDQAEAEHQPALIIQSALLLGKLAFDQGDTHTAEHWLIRAGETLDRDGLDLPELLAPYHLLAAELFTHLGDTETAHQHLEDAKAEFLAFDISDSPYRHQLLLVSAQIHLAQGRLSEASQAAEQALAQAEQDRGPHDPLLIPYLRECSQLQLYANRPDKAMPYLERRLQLAQEQADTQGLAFAEALDDLGTLHLLEEDFDSARVFLQRSLEVYRLQDPTRSTPLITKLLGKLTALEVSLGRYTAAETLALEAIAIEEQRHGPDALSSTVLRHNLAVIYAAQGAHTQALTELERVWAIRHQGLGPDHPATQEAKAQWEAYAEKLTSDTSDTSATPP